MKPVFECYREIIPDFFQFQEILQTPVLTHLRVNTLKIEPERLVPMLKERGILLRKALEENNTLYHAPELHSPGNLLEYFLGYIHPQAFTSCLPAMVLSPGKESFVLDMCSAPGGKTSQLAQMMKNSGLIVANELFQDRHIPLGYTLSRLGVLNAIVTGYQAQEFPKRQRFDYILADVPCSGEGKFRKKERPSPDKRDREKAGFSNMQKRIILRGFDLLKEGGEMVYATCTYNPEENEAVVDHLLKSRDAKLLPIGLSLKHDPGLCGWGKETYDRRLEITARFYPHRFDSVGFYMARIGK